VWADTVEEQIGALFKAICLPADWQYAIQEIFVKSQVNGGFDPRAEIVAIKEELRELREMKRRELYDGDEHVFWREVETLQEKLEALQQTHHSRQQQCKPADFHLRDLGRLDTRRAARVGSDRAAAGGLRPGNEENHLRQEFQLPRPLWERAGSTTHFNFLSPCGRGQGPPHTSISSPLVGEGRVHHTLQFPLPL
jgi:hypothetical protein